MRENLTSGSMRGGWNRSSEAQTIYAPTGNRRGTLVGLPVPPRQPPTPPNLRLTGLVEGRNGRLAD